MTTDTQKPEKGKRGAPLANKNATKHGLRASGLPPGCTYVQGQISAFRRYVRNELGQLSLWQEATLQSAIRHETRALLAARWLRLNEDKLSIAERLNLLKTISDATDRRDKCLAAIGLDGKPANPWEVLDVQSSEPEKDDNDT